jgi:hypothetical protein
MNGSYSGMEGRPLEHRSKPSNVNDEIWVTFDNVCRTDVPAKTYDLREFWVQKQVPDRRCRLFLLGLTYSSMVRTPQCQQPRFTRIDD